MQSRCSVKRTSLTTPSGARETIWEFHRRFIADAQECVDLRGLAAKTCRQFQYFIRYTVQTYTKERWAVSDVTMEISASIVLSLSMSSRLYGIISYCHLTCRNNPPIAPPHENAVGRSSARRLSPWNQNICSEY
jgi:hypothetical protein